MVSKLTDFLMSSFISVKVSLTSLKLESTSMDCLISLVAFLNSPMARPMDLARSGNFFGPITMRAMASINSAVQQNVSGTTQLEEMANKISEVGGTLKEMVARYRV